MLFITKRRFDVQELYEEYQDFFDGFENNFIDYFASLALAYYKVYSREQIRLIAHNIYKEVLDMDANVSADEEELFNQMRKDGVMIGFFISRAMLYLLEHFIAHIRQLEIYSHKSIEQMVIHITHFIKNFEMHVCDKYAVQPIHLNFDSQSNFIVGNNIVDILKRLKNEGKSVQFFNLYKGVPISHEAEIVDIDGEEVVFKTTSIQEIAMKIDDNAYILKDDVFGKHIKADIVYNNFSNNTVVLNNFTYLLNMPASQREFIRVHPDISAIVKMSEDSQNLTQGKLFDLSINGLGVVSEDNNGLFAGAKIEIEFELLIGKKKEKIQSIGEILNIIEYKDSYRYCIKIFPTPEEENSIVRYVNLREKEIIKNLEDILSDYR
ncbi:MAG TPA: pilus assembly protein PilZ [Sulfurospirillum sp. UBA12182]|nr:MAG TPA: pilus assembly protein PilZ [Sulfurospirillum sp. UBA12182]